MPPSRRKSANSTFGGGVSVSVRPMPGTRVAALFLMLLALAGSGAGASGTGAEAATWNVSVLMYDEEGADECAGVPDDRLDDIYQVAAQAALNDAKLPSAIQVNLDYVSLDDDCRQTGGLLTLVRLLSNDSVRAVVGAVSSAVCRAAATFARVRSKTFVSWGCVGLPHVDPELAPEPPPPPPSRTRLPDRVGSSDGSKNASTVVAVDNVPPSISSDGYVLAGNGSSGSAQSGNASPRRRKRKRRPRYFFRISPPAVRSARALVRVLRYFGWRQSAIVASEDEAWLALANRVDVAVREDRLIVRHFIVLHRAGDGASPDHVLDKLDGISPQVKAIILCVPLASMEMAHVMQAATRLRMLDGRHAFVAVHVRQPFVPSPTAVDTRQSAVAVAFQPLVFTYLPPDATYLRTWNRHLPGRFNITGEVHYQLFYRVYDCVALLLSVLLSRNSRPPATSAPTIGSATSGGNADDWVDDGEDGEVAGEEEEEKVVRAEGYLGPILTTPSRGVHAHYTLLYYDGRAQHRPLLYVREDNVTKAPSGDERWPPLPPADPECAGEDCMLGTTSGGATAQLTLLHLIVIVISSAFLCLGLIFAAYFVRRLMRHGEMTKGPYGILIYAGDLVLVANSNQNNKILGDFSALEKPDLLKGSHDSLRGFGLNSGNGIGSDHLISRARYNGDLVMVKYFNTKGFELRNKAIKELKMIYDLRNENVTAFLGFYVNPERPALVFEYSTRGSLQDVLGSDNIKLDWAFKLSLLTDLVRGVKYLHSSPVRVHGRLTSRNCVIDSRWVLKVTDYGLPSFYAAQGLAFPKPTASELLWTAPELLRHDCALRRCTQAGDVYSFSIIMQEMLVRGQPYCMLPLSHEEIIEKVMHPPPMIRPSVSKQAAPPEAINIMRECWAEVPDMRPDFAVIYEQFKRLNHGKKVNIVDTMFQMLEKYSNNLEEIIRERTEQLGDEKKKTEQLLHRMLPSLVAERLKVGLPVEPESYEEVTIYFSDIVGFTTISAYSTPMEVVDLLNDLYTCFDGTINGYNVYKVETIGDAYMVVGGLPVRIEDHACQVATMALDLLHQSGKFRITHLPHTPLKLRIGIHTGSCCSGVVGLTMPRYCLFGDTVNTASRMESTGNAWRIHISQATKDKLDLAGGYHMSCRGEIDIKGKGKATTYWLHGKNGFDKPLPQPTDDELDEELVQQCLASSLAKMAAESDRHHAAQLQHAHDHHHHHHHTHQLHHNLSSDDGHGSPTYDAIDPCSCPTEPRSSMDSGDTTASGEHVLLPPTLHHHVTSSGGNQQHRRGSRRTLSNASDILALAKAAAAANGAGSSSADSHSLHSQHLHVQQHHHPPTQAGPSSGCILTKPLEYIANANSYILNMNRAHSLDSGDGSTSGGSGACRGGGSEGGHAAGGSGTRHDVTSVYNLPERPLTPHAFPLLSGSGGDRAMALHHLLGRTSAAGGGGRRCSEIWEANALLRPSGGGNSRPGGGAGGRSARRFSNPRYCGLSAADERNGNCFLTASGGVSVVSTAPTLSPAGSSDDSRAASECGDSAQVASGSQQRSPAVVVQCSFRDMDNGNDSDDGGTTVAVAVDHHHHHIDNSRFVDSSV